MGKRVLVVDDAAFMRHMIKDILKKLGHEIVGEAGDGEEACAKFEALQPDLVTLDLIMPKKGGLDTLRDIRAKHPTAKVVIISAIEQRESLMTAARLGAIDYLVKPFTKERVAETLTRLSVC
ncbi:MAG: response regulator [Phycisphaerae bacterium]|nr:response regulator [Phycisphaerae bacterium]